MTKTGWILLRRDGKKEITVIKSISAARVGLEAQGFQQPCSLIFFQPLLNIQGKYLSTHMFIHLYTNICIIDYGCT